MRDESSAPSPAKRATSSGPAKNTRSRTVPAPIVPQMDNLLPQTDDSANARTSIRSSTTTGSCAAATANLTSANRNDVLHSIPATSSTSTSRSRKNGPTQKLKAVAGNPITAANSTNSITHTHSKNDHESSTSSTSSRPHRSVKKVKHVQCESDDHMEYDAGSSMTTQTRKKRNGRRCADHKRGEPAAKRRKSPEWYEPGSKVCMRSRMATGKQRRLTRQEIESFDRALEPYIRMFDSCPDTTGERPLDLSKEDQVIDDQKLLKKEDDNKEKETD